MKMTFHPCGYGYAQQVFTVLTLTNFTDVESTAVEALMVDLMFLSYFKSTLTAPSHLSLFITGDSVGFTGLQLVSLPAAVLRSHPVLSLSIVVLGRVVSRSCRSADYYPDISKNSDIV